MQKAFVSTPDVRYFKALAYSLFIRAFRDKTYYACPAAFRAELALEYGEMVSD